MRKNMRPCRVTSSALRGVSISHFLRCMHAACTVSVPCHPGSRAALMRTRRGDRMFLPERALHLAAPYFRSQLWETSRTPAPDAAQSLLVRPPRVWSLLDGTPSTTPPMQVDATTNATPDALPQLGTTERTHSDARLDMDANVDASCDESARQHHQPRRQQWSRTQARSRSSSTLAPSSTILTSMCSESNKFPTLLRLEWMRGVLDSVAASSSRRPDIA